MQKYFIALCIPHFDVAPVDIFLAGTSYLFHKTYFWFLLPKNWLLRIFYVSIWRKGFAI